MPPKKTVEVVQEVELVESETMEAALERLEAEFSAVLTELRERLASLKSFVG